MKRPQGHRQLILRRPFSGSRWFDAPASGGITDKIGFSAFSNRTRTSRSFDRLSDALKEIIDARVWGGIHFRTADVQGAVLGKKVAHWLAKHYFQPLG